MERKNFELMAPVGSWESLQAAIQAGVDSVYFGVDRLNMRSQSTVNFTFEDFAQIVTLCNSHHVKTYLTLNTVMYDQDLELMRELINAAKEHQISAVIASDMAAISYAFSQGVEVHISTQVNVSNIEAVKFYANFADVMVLARELNLEQIAGISKIIKEQHICGPSGNLIRLELFIHGALCMAVSGKCYLSLHEYNKSANRGSCLQLCRRSYIVTDKETQMELEVDNQYIMSPKDLCTIEFLNQVLDAGVTVLKIEGRARSADYVKTVAECYNAAIYSYIDGTFTKEKTDVWKERLSTVFNRGFWGGYYLGQRLGEWSNAYGSKATKKKIYIGKGMNYFANLKVAEFLVETGSLKVGDEILITGPTTGVIETTVKELRVDMKSAEEAFKGDRFSMPVDAQVRRSDKLFKVVPA
ncbi:MAG: U32 family peptidase [Bacteroidota bacterium]|nr:U32 family peptidase [Bacteroidota bacterium]